MTVDKLQSLIRRLANGGWVRYWLYWNAIDCTIMAIQCRNESGIPEPIEGMEAIGFSKESNFIYTISRTNEDGTPYKSNPI